MENIVNHARSHPISSTVPSNFFLKHQNNPFRTVASRISRRVRGNRGNSRTDPEQPRGSSFVYIFAREPRVFLRRVFESAVSLPTVGSSRSTSLVEPENLYCRVLWQRKKEEMRNGDGVNTGDERRARVRHYSLVRKQRVGD